MQIPHTRRFVVNKRTRHGDINMSNTRFSCIIIIFIGIVIILAVLVIYFAATFPLIESKNKSSFLEHINSKLIIENAQKIKKHHNDISDTENNKHIDDKNNDDTNNIDDIAVIDIYNRTQSILIRIDHKSSVSLQAVPFLVGLGAEKSGSTSLGAAMFNSGEFTCPDTDEIDVETKYWSDCFKWNVQNNLDELINKLENKIGGHCSIKQYRTYQRWRNGKYKFEKSVDYLGLPYVTRIFSELFVKKHGTKIFIMIRYPPPRISSTWKFFVGEEKNNMPKQYGNVEKFTKHLLKNDILIEMIDLLKIEDTNKNVMELDWKHEILPKWNEYMISLQKQCEIEAPIAGFKAEFCNPSQLLRRAVGLSCYIVPIMQWIIDLGIENAINSFRIIQSELYFSNGKEIMNRLICWSKQGTMDINNKCDLKQLYQTGSIRIKKLQGTRKNINDFSKELINTLHTIFKPCNDRLFQLLQLYPQLAIKEFIWNEWNYKPSVNVVE